MSARSGKAAKKTGKGAKSPQKAADDGDVDFPHVLGKDVNDAVALQSALVKAEKEKQALEKRMHEKGAAVLKAKSEKQKLAAVAEWQSATDAVTYQEECIEMTKEQVAFIGGSLSGVRDSGAKSSKSDDADDDEEDDAGHQLVVKELRKKLGRQKLMAPKKTYTGVEDWNTFHRWANTWFAKYEESYTDAEIGREFMEIISGEAEKTVHAMIRAGKETFSGIMEALKKMHGVRVGQETQRKEFALTSHKRAGAKFGEFLKEHTRRMADALAVGEQWSAKTAGQKLLNAAELSTAQETQIKATIRTRDKLEGRDEALPRYDDVLEELWGLAEAFTAVDDKRAAEKEVKKRGKGNADTATGLMTHDGVHANADGKKKWWQGGGKWKGGKAKGKGKGKWNGKGKSYGKGGKGKGKGKYGFYGKGGKGKGKGKWSNKWYSNDWQGGQQQQQQWNDRCRFDAEGKPCPYGDECKFKHTSGSNKRERPESGDGKDEGGAAPDAKRPRIAPEGKGRTGGHR